MLHKQITSRTDESPLTYFLTPKIIVESTPILLVKVFLRLIRTGCPEKDVVTKKVGGEEGLAACVERLKYDLCVIALFQINRNNLQRIL